MTQLNEVDVLLLCGGLGTRLRSTIGSRQKVAAEVAGRPFLGFQLERLARFGIRHVILAAGFGAEQIAAAVSDDHFGMDVELSVESRPLGTGGAIKSARSRARGRKWIIMNGDCFSQVDFEAMVRFHDERQAMVTLAVARRDDAHDYGTIDLDAQNRILAFREKETQQTTGWVSVGVYCFEHRAFDRMPAREVFSVEKDFFPSVLDEAVYGFLDNGTFLDIGTPERFAQAQHVFKRTAL